MVQLTPAQRRQQKLKEEDLRRQKELAQVKAALALTAEQEKLRQKLKNTLRVSKETGEIKKKENEEKTTTQAIEKTRGTASTYANDTNAVIQTSTSRLNKLIHAFYPNIFESIEITDLDKLNHWQSTATILAIYVGWKLFSSNDDPTYITDALNSAVSTIRDTVIGQAKTEAALQTLTYTSVGNLFGSLSKLAGFNKIGDLAQITGQAAAVYKQHSTLPDQFFQEYLYTFLISLAESAALPFAVKNLPYVIPALTTILMIENDMSPNFAAVLNPSIAQGKTLPKDAIFADGGNGDLKIIPEESDNGWYEKLYGLLDELSTGTMKDGTRIPVMPPDETIKKLNGNTTEYYGSLSTSLQDTRTNLWNDTLKEALQKQTEAKHATSNGFDGHSNEKLFHDASSYLRLKSIASKGTVSRITQDGKTTIQIYLNDDQIVLPLDTSTTPKKVYTLSLPKLFGQYEKNFGRNNPTKFIVVVNEDNKTTQGVYSYEDNSDIDKMLKTFEGVDGKNISAIENIDLSSQTGLEETHPWLTNLKNRLEQVQNKDMIRASPGNFFCFRTDGISHVIIDDSFYKIDNNDFIISETTTEELLTKHFSNAVTRSTRFRAQEESDFLINNFLTVLGVFKATDTATQFHKISLISPADLVPGRPSTPKVRIYRKDRKKIVSFFETYINPSNPKDPYGDRNGLLKFVKKDVLSFMDRAIEIGRFELFVDNFLDSKNDDLFAIWSTNLGVAMGRAKYFTVLKDSIDTTYFISNTWIENGYIFDKVRVLYCCKCGYEINKKGVYYDHEDKEFMHLECAYIYERVFPTEERNLPTSARDSIKTFDVKQSLCQNKDKFDPKKFKDKWEAAKKKESTLINELKKLNSANQIEKSEYQKVAKAFGIVDKEFCWRKTKDRFTARKCAAVAVYAAMALGVLTFVYNFIYLFSVLRVMGTNVRLTFNKYLTEDKTRKDPESAVSPINGTLRIPESSSLLDYSNSRPLSVAYDTRSAINWFMSNFKSQTFNLLPNEFSEVEVNRPNDHEKIFTIGGNEYHRVEAFEANHNYNTTKLGKWFKEEARFFYLNTSKVNPIGNLADSLLAIQDPSGELKIYETFYSRGLADFGTQLVERANETQQDDFLNAVAETTLQMDIGQLESLISKLVNTNNDLKELFRPLKDELSKTLYLHDKNGKQFDPMSDSTKEKDVRNLALYYNQTFETKEGGVINAILNYLGYGQTQEGSKYDFELIEEFQGKRENTALEFTSLNPGKTGSKFSPDKRFANPDAKNNYNDTYSPQEFNRDTLSKIGEINQFSNETYPGIKNATAPYSSDQASFSEDAIDRGLKVLNVPLTSDSIEPYKILLHAIKWNLMKEKYNQLQTEQGKIIKSNKFQDLIKAEGIILTDMFNVLTRVDELLRARNQNDISEILDSINTNNDIQIFIKKFISEYLVSGAGNIDIANVRAFRNRLIYDDSFATIFKDFLTRLLNQIN